MLKSIELNVKLIVEAFEGKNYVVSNFETCLISRAFRRLLPSVSHLQESLPKTPLSTQKIIRHFFTDRLILLGVKRFLGLPNVWYIVHMTLVFFYLK